MSKQFTRTVRRVAAQLRTMTPPDRLLFIAGLEFILATSRLERFAREMDSRENARAFRQEMLDRLTNDHKPARRIKSAKKPSKKGKR